MWGEPPSGGVGNEKEGSRFGGVATGRSVRLQVEVYGSRGGGRKWSWEGIEEFLREIVEQAKQKGVREVPVPLAYFAEYYNGGNFEEFANIL